MMIGLVVVKAGGYLAALAGQLVTSDGVKHLEG
jgi:hypothetical protein